MPLLVNVELSLLSAGRTEGDRSKNKDAAAGASR